MRPKLVYSNYDKETGISVAAIKNKRGVFVGTSKLHKEDKPYASDFAGCRYAEIKALIKEAKAHKKELRLRFETLTHLENELKNIKNYNPYTLEMRRIRRKKYEYQAEIKKLEAQIKEAQEGLYEAMKERDFYMKKIEKGKYK